MEVLSCSNIKMLSDQEMYDFNVVFVESEIYQFNDVYITSMILLSNKLDKLTSLIYARVYVQYDLFKCAYVCNIFILVYNSLANIQWNLTARSRVGGIQLLLFNFNNTKIISVSSTFQEKPARFKPQM